MVGKQLHLVYGQHYSGYGGNSTVVNEINRKTWCAEMIDCGQHAPLNLLGLVLGVVWQQLKIAECVFEIDSERAGTANVRRHRKGMSLSRQRYDSV